MTTTRTLILCAFASLTTVACADDPAFASSAPAFETARDDVDALDTLLKGGDFRFALAESAVVAKVRAGCEASPDVDACMDEVAAEAAGEGVRITPLGADRVRYLSYVHEDGEEKIHLEAEARVVAVEPGIVAFVDPSASTEPLPEGAHVLVEVVDDDTIAMDKVPGTHPRSGDARLVFRRR